MQFVDSAVGYVVQKLKWDGGAILVVIHPRKPTLLRFRWDPKFESLNLKSCGNTRSVYISAPEKIYNRLWARGTESSGGYQCRLGGLWDKLQFILC